jgi:outer membrane protein TolC
VASADAESTAFGYEETVNRVLRDARITYVELVLVRQMRDIVIRNRATVTQFLGVAEARYAVGQGAQADVLKAQTRLTGMTDELLRIEREESTVQAELHRLLDESGAPMSIVPIAFDVVTHTLDPAALRGAAAKNRPQLRGLERMIDRADREVALMQREYYPDFDVRLTYGQREPALDGMSRGDMVSLTVAVNLPIWRRSRLEPQVAEARAMRDRTREMFRAQTAETLATLDAQVAVVEQSRRSRDLIDAGLLPQSRLAVESSLAAYRVGRVDFATLLDNQMVVYSYELERVRASASEAKALAEIGLLIGESPE